MAVPPLPPARGFTLASALSAPLAIAFATSIAVTSGATLLYPALPVLAADLHVDKSQIGLAMAAYTLPAVVLAPLFGILADLRGRRRMLIFGLGLFGLAGGAAAFAPSYPWFLGLRVLQGIGMSALTPLTIALLSDLLPEDQQIGGQGCKVVLDRVAMILLPLAGGMLAALSWRIALLPYLLIAPLAIAAYAWMPETCQPGADTLRRYLPRAIRAAGQPRLRIAFATGFLRFFLDYGLFTYLPVLVALHQNASATISGWLIAASAVGSIVTATSIGRIHGRQPEERLLAIAFFACAFGLALIALDPSLWLVALATFVFGLGNGVISPLQKNLLTSRTPANLRGGVISVDRVIQQIAKSLSPSLMGLLLLVAKLEVVFWILCGASAAGMLTLLIVSGRRARTA